MGLRATAAADLRAITENSATGFGWAITITDPLDVVGVLTGLSTDIGQTIDPETGVAVAGRRASIAVAIASLTAVGLGIPKAIADGAGKPWRVAFLDIAGVAHIYKVSESMPDRSIGIVTCILEHYKAA